MHLSHPSPELLRSFLDRTLGPEQLRQLDDHLAACRGCREHAAGAAPPWPTIWTTLGSAAAAEPDHPGPGRMVSYLRGRLDPIDVETVESHLEGCAACAAALTALPEFTAMIAPAAPGTAASSLALVAVAPALQPVAAAIPARLESRRDTDAAMQPYPYVPALTPWQKVRAFLAQPGVRLRLQGAAAGIAVSFGSVAVLMFGFQAREKASGRSRLAALPVLRIGQRVVVSRNPAAGEFAEIEEAIRAATPGTEIRVRPGIYSGFTIDRFVAITGEGPREAIVVRGTHGSSVRMTADEATIRGIHLECVAGGAGRPAVEVARGTLTLNSCSLTSKGEAALVVRAGGAADVNNCTLQSAEDAGIQVGWGARASVQGGTVHDCGGSAVRVEGGTAELKGVRLLENRRNGLRVYAGGRCTLRDCQIVGNREQGVEVLDPGSHVEVYGGTVRDGMSMGVHAHAGGYAVVEGCQVANNGKQGAPAEWAPGIDARNGGVVEVRKSLITRNGLAGVWAGFVRADQHGKQESPPYTHGTVTLSGCTLTENSGPGIMAVAGGRVTARDGRITGQSVAAKVAGGGWALLERNSIEGRLVGRVTDGGGNRVGTSGGRGAF